jgi:Aspartyl/Asparaginyl beta-hydroxylase
MTTIDYLKLMGLRAPQAIYKREEIPIADYLMSFQQDLIDDYMEGFSSLKEAILAQSFPVLDRRERGQPLHETEHLIKTKDENGEFVPNVNAWQSGGIRYRHPDANIKSELDAKLPKAKKWKTACKIVEEFGEDCPIANYSAIAPNSVLGRHTGVENRTGVFVRFHIPLIIPIGDVFLEVNGEETTWDDCFAFNNQLPHSAHNYTDEYRLIFLIDFRRSRIGMPPAPAYDKRLELLAKPFNRNKKDI